jgi:hypothetical protein
VRDAVGAAALAAALLAAACGADLKGAGDECFASSECGSGLLCNFAVDPPRCEPQGSGAPEPDAPTVPPSDAEPGTPDAAPGTPDAAPNPPDAAPNPPDAAQPDAAQPDAALPDAAVP